MNSLSDENEVSLTAGINQYRENLYLFLSRAFSREADKALLDDGLKVMDALKILGDPADGFCEEEIQKGQQLLEEFFRALKWQTSDEQVLVRLSKEYAALFLGAGAKNTAPLCESVYRGQSASLFQEPYFEVKKCYAEIGLQKDNDFSEPDDHLSLELAYMAKLCRLFIESREDTGGAGYRYLEIQAEFIEKHLKLWVPAFLERLQNLDGSNFYKGCGLILNGFLKADLVLMDFLIQELKTENTIRGGGGQA